MTAFVRKKQTSRNTNSSIIKPSFSETMWRWHTFQIPFNIPLHGHISDRVLRVAALNCPAGTSFKIPPLHSHKARKNISI